MGAAAADLAGDAWSLDVIARRVFKPGFHVQPPHAATE